MLKMPSFFRRRPPRPPTITYRFNIFRVSGQPGWENCISWLSTAEAARIGLPTEAIIAIILRANTPLDDTNLLGNAPFPPFLQRCMPFIIEVSPTIRAVAERVRDGVLHIPDRRYFQPWSFDPREYPPPPFTVIGSVQVRGGAIVPYSYQANLSYRGFVPKQGAFGIAAVPEEFCPTMLDLLGQAGGSG